VTITVVKPRRARMAHGQTANDYRPHSRSADRKFDKHFAVIDNKQIGMRKLCCVEPGCGQQGELIDRTRDGLPPDVIERKFKQKGWTVGYDSTGDLCPSCTATKQAQRRTKRLKPIIVNEAAAEPAVLPQEATVQHNGAEQPLKISPSDWRIIHAKLEEVYDDPDRGYKPPWTDASVARDLGSHLPVEWIAEVRERAFGPAKDNEEIRDMLARVKDATEKAKGLIEEAKGHRTQVEALVANHNDLMKRCREVAKSLDGLLAIAERIERAVKP
jgi:hypothetical protein